MASLDPAATSTTGDFLSMMQSIMNGGGSYASSSNNPFAAALGANAYGSSGAATTSNGYSSPQSLYGMNIPTLASLMANAQASNAASAIAGASSGSGIMASNFASSMASNHPLLSSLINSVGSNGYGLGGSSLGGYGSSSNPSSASAWGLGSNGMGSGSAWNSLNNWNVPAGEAFLWREKSNKSIAFKYLLDLESVEFDPLSPPSFTSLLTYSSISGSSLESNDDSSPSSTSVSEFSTSDTNAGMRYDVAVLICSVLSSFSSSFFTFLKFVFDFATRVSFPPFLLFLLFLLFTLLSLPVFLIPLPPLRPIDNEASNAQSNNVKRTVDIIPSTATVSTPYLNLLSSPSVSKVDLVSLHNKLNQALGSQDFTYVGQVKDCSKMKQVVRGPDGYLYTYQEFKPSTSFAIAQLNLSPVAVDASAAATTATNTTTTAAATNTTTTAAADAQTQTPNVLSSFNVQNPVSYGWLDLQDVSAEGNTGSAQNILPYQQYIYDPVVAASASASASADSSSSSSSNALASTVPTFILMKPFKGPLASIWGLPSSASYGSSNSYGPSLCGGGGGDEGSYGSYTPNPEYGSYAPSPEYGSYV
eukprot:CAMPEP_0175062252 /NCGR_PEP_ID=MMETSP0052_2-20121109/14058_1 /TAXON_ID=51329 ORGANISM="Polytomella parva, Strain SAG 63-3" /NCGR_SAMPLE_ID=MMETSP0052_2 /ASSEMBLY_ACC=CAM_ASM_000194 /LENGTH=588 /DNA_ID=CAMNT_0016328239 /DNA_START=1477 /DNA_END=3243 /DNA_ORIENTATION=+